MGTLRIEPEEGEDRDLEAIAEEGTVQTPAADARPPEDLRRSADVEPDEEEVGQHGASLAARLKAKRRQLENRQHTFDVPPEDVWGDELKVRCGPVKLKDGQPLRTVIADATLEVLIRDEDTGELNAVHGGWAGVATLMGHKTTALTDGQVVALVCGSTECVKLLGTQVVAWIMGVGADSEQQLGE